MYYASGVYSEHVRVVRIHPRYRGTPPEIEGALDLVYFAQDIPATDGLAFDLIFPHSS